MNDNIDDTESPRGDIPTDPRPLGFWLRAVDHLITREFDAALESEGVGRREWMLLNALSGDVDAPGLDAMIARRGKRLRSLERRGWITLTDDGAELTDEGRAAKARLHKQAQSVRAKVASAVSDEDFATLTASLEAIARELGWDQSVPFAPETGWHGRRRGRRGFGPGRRGFGPGRRGFGPHGRGFGSHGRGFGPHGHHACDLEHHEYHHGHGHSQPADHAFERGFGAGFRAANGAAAASDSAV